MDSEEREATKAELRAAKDAGDISLREYLEELRRLRSPQGARPHQRSSGSAAASSAASCQLHVHQRLGRVDLEQQCTTILLTTLQTSLTRMVVHSRDNGNQSPHQDEMRALHLALHLALRHVPLHVESLEAGKAKNSTTTKTTTIWRCTTLSY